MLAPRLSEKLLVDRTVLFAVKISFLESTLLHVLKDIQDHENSRFIPLYGDFAWEMYYDLAEMVGETWLAEQGVVVIGGNLDQFTSKTRKRLRQHTNNRYKMRFNEKDIKYYG